MTTYGYARVSTTDQSFDTQEEALRTAGAEIVRAEKASGSKMDGRPELATLLAFLRAGDTLMCTKVDRLARSVRDLQEIVHTLKERGVALRCVDQPIDTSTAAGKCFLDMLGVFAEFENSIRRERQAAGIAAAKLKGVYKGRKRSIDRERVQALKAAGKGPSAIADELGISRQSVYRILA